MSMGVEPGNMPPVAPGTFGFMGAPMPIALWFCMAWTIF